MNNNYLKKFLFFIFFFCVFYIITPVAPWFVSTAYSKQAILVGQESPLWCQARGAPAPIITWSKDSNVLQNGTSVIYNLASNEKHGRYVCVASNSFGSVTMNISTDGQCK